jgi:predicted transposase YdaD
MIFKIISIIIIIKFTLKNIKFNIKNVLDDLTEDLIKNVKIVMIDIDHYETIENKIMPVRLFIVSR